MMPVAAQAGIKMLDFWNMTLKEIRAEIDGYIENNRLNDARTGRICAVIAEVNRDRKRKKEPFNETDFIPGYKKKQQTKQEMADNLKMIASAFGCKVVMH